jgi:hypothetical protein
MFHAPQFHTRSHCVRNVGGIVSSLNTANSHEYNWWQVICSTITQHCLIQFVTKQTLCNVTATFSEAMSMSVSGVGPKDDSCTATILLFILRFVPVTKYITLYKGIS